MISLDRFISSRLHGSANYWSRSQWERSKVATDWLYDRRSGDSPFPKWLMHEGMKADHDTPAPSVFISGVCVDWFEIAERHREISLSVDFEPAPRLETVRRAFELSGRDAEILVVAFAGKKPGTYDLSVEALYLPRSNAATIARISAVFGIEPNGDMDFGWEWFGGWP